MAIGRALVRDPTAFLLDEPLSNLDAKLRTSMRSELARLHERLGVTTVYVTHDQVEAMTLGDRVVVLRDGVVQQCDRPQALYRTPANLFVAAFIGSPAMNLVEARRRDGDRVRFAGHELALPRRRAAARAARAGRPRAAAVRRSWSTGRGADRTGRRCACGSSWSSTSATRSTRRSRSTRRA